MTRLSVPGKLGMLRENVRQMGDIPQDTLEAFLVDFRNLQAALHLLQVSIQILIDLAAYACARRGVAPTGTSFGLVTALEEAGFLTHDAAARCAPILGFRNRVVHLYDRVDPEIVWHVLREHRVELLELAEKLVAAGGDDPL